MIPSIDCCGWGEPANMIVAPCCFFQEERAESFFVVLNGWVKLSRETVEGDEYVIGMFSRGESFAEAAIFDSGRFPVTAEAVEPARVLVVPAKPFMETISLDPQLAMSMLATMSRRLRHLVTQVEQLQAKSAPQRVGAFLLRLSDGVDGAITVQLPYDKSLIAARLGMKPETFSRALAKLRHLGIHSVLPPYNWSTWFEIFNDDVEVLGWPGSDILTRMC